MTLELLEQGLISGSHPFDFGPLTQLTTKTTPAGSYGRALVELVPSSNSRMSVTYEDLVLTSHSPLA